MFVIGRRMRDEMKHSEERNGVSWLHFEALRYITDAGKPTMRDLATYFSITPPAATLLVDGLVRNGMLRRIIDPKDRRAVRIGLTPKGMRTIEQGIRERREKIAEVFSVLNKKEHNELARILTKIAHS